MSKKLAYDTPKEEANSHEEFTQYFVNKRCHLIFHGLLEMPLVKKGPFLITDLLLPHFC